jgi:hypothetical protein
LGYWRGEIIYTMSALFCFKPQRSQRARRKIGKLCVLRVLCGEFFSGAIKSAKVVYLLTRTTLAVENIVSRINFGGCRHTKKANFWWLL